MQALVISIEDCWLQQGDLRGDNGGDEELRAIGVLAGVGHGQEALLRVLELEVLVLEAVAIDYRFPCQSMENIR